MEINKGIIRGFSGSYRSGLAFLFLEDQEGIRSISCENGPTVRALVECFGKGVLGPAHTVNDKDGPHLGQEIFWSFDEAGITLAGFTPARSASAELIKAWENGKDKT